MTATDRIPLQRAYAVLSADKIVVYPSRAQLIGSAIEVAIAGVAIAVIAAYMAVLPSWVLIVLLLLSLILGPVGVLGLVFSVMGTAFLMDREAGSARWQQGFLGMGIGTTDGMPFERIAAVAVASDADLALRSGQQQDVITFEVFIARADGKRLPVGSVVAARVFAEEGAVRANRLAAALAEMAGVPAMLAPVPGDETEEVEVEEAGARQSRRRLRRVATRPARRGDAE